MCECTHEDKTLDLGDGFRIGSGRLEGWFPRVEGGTVACLKRDFQDFRIGRIGGGSEKNSMSECRRSRGTGNQRSPMLQKSGLRKSLGWGEGVLRASVCDPLQITFPYQTGSIRLSDFVQVHSMMHRSSVISFHPKLVRLDIETHTNHFYRLTSSWVSIPNWFD